MAKKAPVKESLKEGLDFVREMIAKGASQEDDLFNQIMAQRPPHHKGVGLMSGLRSKDPGLYGLDTDYLDTDGLRAREGLDRISRIDDPVRNGREITGGYGDLAVTNHPDPSFLSPWDTKIEPGREPLDLSGEYNDPWDAVNKQGAMPKIKDPKGKGWGLSDFGNMLKRNKGRIAGYGIGGGLLAGLTGYSHLTANDTFTNKPEDQAEVNPNKSSNKSGSKGAGKGGALDSFLTPENYQIKDSNDAARLLRMLAQDSHTKGDRDDQFRSISKEGVAGKHSKDQKDFYQGYVNDEFDLIKKLAAQQGVKIDNNEVYKQAFL